MTATSEQKESAETGCESSNNNFAMNSKVLNGGAINTAISVPYVTTETVTSSIISDSLKFDQSPVTSSNNNIPQSPSSTDSSEHNGRSTIKGQTTSLSKFKEKRPEPLNLISSLHQDIPLDLSVKSAGNVPSGGNIFNLVSANQTTLETPRIVWHDNEALLLKQRLFSSSACTSQRIRLSSLAGDSPPMTPGTPFLDLICSPTSRSAGGYLNHMSNPFQDSTSSLHWLMSTHTHHRQQQLQHQKIDNDNFLNSQSHNRQLPSNKLLIYHLKGNELAKTPRRSCSTENLNSTTGIRSENHSFRAFRASQQIHEKKSTTSPLVFKNLSDPSDKSERFSYNILQRSGHKLDFTERDAGNKKPLDNYDISMKSSQHSLTSNSVANATTNLLNIHLHSPTLAQGVDFEGFISANLSRDSSLCTLPVEQNLDSQLLNTYCSRTNNNLDTTLVGAPNTDKHNVTLTLPNKHITTLTSAETRANAFNSFSSPTTLNTPTLISPNQLKTGFSPSPTLSPMSSVFELPSPLLLSPPPNHSSSNSQGVIDELLESKRNAADHISSTKSNIDSVAKRRVEEIRKKKPHLQFTVNSSEMTNKSSPNIILNKQDTNLIRTQDLSPNLSHLVTSAKDKMTNFDSSRNEELNLMDVDTIDNIAEDISMCIDETVENVNHKEVATKQKIKQETQALIPMILVSNCLSKQLPQEHKNDLINQQSKQHLNEKGEKFPTSKNVGIQFQENQRPGDPSFLSVESQVVYTNQQRLPRDVVNKRALSPSSFKMQIHHYSNNRIESSSAPPDMHELRARPKVKCATKYSNSLRHPMSKQISSPTNQASQRQQLTETNPTNSHYRSNAPYPELQISNWDCITRSSSAEPLRNELSHGQNFPYCQQNFPQLTSLNYSQHHQQRSYHDLPNFKSNISLSAQQLQTDSLRSNLLPNASMLHHQHNQFQVKQQQHRSISELQENFSQHQSQSPAITNLQQTNCQLAVTLADPLYNQLNNFSTYETQKSNHQFIPPPTGSNHDLNVGVSSQAIAQDETEVHFRINELPIHPRALSADARGLSRSDSSCNSADFCFRSSSATSGAAAKKYNCNFCSRAFTRSDMLTRHKRLHSGDRPFQCNECKQEFSRSDHLSTHMRTHTGEKPYKCKLCSYSACRKDMITRHMKVHSRSSPNSQPLELAR